MSTGNETSSSKASPLPNIMPLPDEFLSDLDKLGRANGNVFQRKPGLDNVHDGQVMVRLKKKRFIVIDYECENDKKKSCANSSCEKVGFPKSLYDSDPSEPESLYLRSGLCFTCQRSLNEKRRTQRKRKSDVSGIGTVSPSSISLGASAISARNTSFATVFNGFGGTVGKRIKFHDEIIELSDNEILIQCPMEGVRNAEHDRKDGESYTFADIGVDLCAFAHENAENIDQLVEAVEKVNALDASSKATASAVKDAVTAAVSDIDMPEIADAAVTAAVSGLTVPDVTESASSESIGQVPTEEYNQQSLLGLASKDAINDEVVVLFEKAMLSMRKSIYLLNQWKISWDMTRSAKASGKSLKGSSSSDVNITPEINSSKAASREDENVLALEKDKAHSTVEV